MKFFRPNQPLISVWIARYITFSYAPRCTSAPTSGGLIFTVPIFGAKTGCKHRPKVLVKYGDGLFLSPGLDGPGSNPGGGRDFPPVQTGPGAHPASCKMGTGFYPRGKCGRDVLLTTHPLLVPRSWKSRAIPLPTLWATPGLERDHFTFFTVFKIQRRSLLMNSSLNPQSQMFYFDAKFLVCRFCNCSRTLPVGWKTVHRCILPTRFESIYR